MNNCRPSRHSLSQCASFVRLLCLAVGACSLAGMEKQAIADIRYVDASQGNDANPGTSEQPWRTMAKAISAVLPGDTVYLRPGNYGNVTINGGYGNPDQWVTYAADPATTAARPSHWFEERIDRPSAADSVIFTGLAFASRDNAGTALGHYVIVDGVNILDPASRAIRFDPCVAYAIVRNCNAFGNMPPDPYYHLSGERTAAGISLYSSGMTDWHDILIDSCYVELVTTGIMLNGHFGENIVIRGCHVVDTSSSPLNLADYETATGTIVVDGCHLHDQNAKADTLKTTNYVGAPDGSQPNRIFTYSGSDPDVTSNWICVQDSDGDSGGASVVRRVSWNTTTRVVTLDTPLPFNVEGGDRLQWYNGNHGSGITIRAHHLRIRNNRIHDAGATGGIYNYVEGVSDLVIENNLLYDILNTSQPFNLNTRPAGNNIIIRNNTVVGTRARTYPGVVRYRYGMAFELSYVAGTDPDTIEICNNLFVGQVKAYATTIQNNIAYYDFGGTFQRDNEGGQQGNFIYYNGETYPNEPAPFEGTAFFVGCEGFDEGFTTHHGQNFNEAFRLAETAKAVGFAAPAYSTAADITGSPRDAAPDAGCYEYSEVIGGNHAPVLALIGSKTATVGQSLTFQVSAQDADGDPLTYSISGDLPANATFSQQTFTWTPASDQIGVSEVTFTVSDGQREDFETVTIVVGRPNTAPMFVPVGEQSVQEDEPLNLTLVATDADGDAITYSASNVPAGAVLTGQVFSWTPSYQQAGSYEVTFVADDGQAQDSQVVTITVVNVNRPPILTAIGDRSIDASNTLSLTLSATDPDGDGLTYSAAGLPSGADLTGQAFNWTPASGQSGSYEITFVASDGQLTDSETVTVMVVSAVSASEDSTAPVVARLSPTPETIQVPLNNLVTLHITDAGMGVDAASVTITVDGAIVYEGDTEAYRSAHGQCSRSGARNDYRFIYQHERMFDYDRPVTVRVNATDLAGNAMNEFQYSFMTEMRAFGRNKPVGERTGASADSRPATASDAAGNIWAAWHAGSADSRDIYVAKLSLDADTFATPIRLTTDPGDQCHPDLAVGTDGSVYVAWQDNRNGHWDIYASVCTDGVQFAREIRVTDSNDNEINPAVTVDNRSPNHVYVAWQDSRNGNQDIYVADSANAFASTAVSRVTSDAADQIQPDIAVDAQNALYLVWTDTRSGQPDIYGAASNIGPWVNWPIVIGAGDQTDPALAIEPGGSMLHLLWVDDAAGDADVRYASSNGLPDNPVAGISIIDDTSGADQSAPAIICGPDGKVFACWQDSRHVGIYGTDTDLYFAELDPGAAKTNILVGDDGTSANQMEPAIGINSYGQPYIVWTDDRSSDPEVFYAGTTFIDPNPLDSKIVIASQGAIIGTDPEAIKGPEDVSIVVPGGACQTNLRMAIARILNPQVSLVDCLGSYDFGPSGVDFDQPVTVTIPYVWSGGRGGRAKPYWYDSLTGVMSQQGITEVENIPLSSKLNALRFKTTHFTPFYLVASGSEDTLSNGGIGGGCSLSPAGDGSPEQLLVPCGIIALVMIVLRHRDRNNARKLAEA